MTVDDFAARRKFFKEMATAHARIIYMELAAHRRFLAELRVVRTHENHRVVTFANNEVQNEKYMPAYFVSGCFISRLQTGNYLKSTYNSQHWYKQYLINDNDGGRQ